MFKAASSSEEDTPHRGAIQRILLVDDSRLQRRILSASLMSAGYEVIEAASGEEALKMCQETSPDLVLSDWIMPGMDGIEFCQAFRALEQEKYGYFILLTSKSEKAEIAKGLEGGADDFLIKPVNAHELRARIGAGERIVRMQRELTQKNSMISDTLDELQRVYDSLDHDLKEAKKLQQSLVRDRYKDFGTGVAALTLQSSGHVGGDLVGHFRISDSRVGLYSIDVSGHGISSALMTARLAGFLSSNSPEQNVALKALPNGRQGYHPPNEVIQRLNQIIMDEMETEHYFTMLLAVVNLQTGHVEMAQAGHPHPVILRRDGRIEQNGPGGLPVGLIEGAEFAPFSVDLSPGDRVLILSDGVTECPNQEGIMLCEEGLEELVKNLPARDVTGTLNGLLEKLQHFAGGIGFPDDVSGILFEYRGPWF